MPDTARSVQVVVADDKAFIRNLIQGMLHKFGDFDVLHANSGEEALELLNQRRSRIQCVIADWNMEPIDGLELLQTIRQGRTKGVDRGLPFIMLTAHADSPIVKSAIQFDISGYLVKPVSHDKLKSAVENALNASADVKDPTQYASVKRPQVPKELKEGEVRKSAWVVWNRDRYKLWKVDDTLDQIRMEAEHQIRQQAELLDIRNKRLRPLDKVPVGTVLADDILDEDGSLLLAAGIVLNESLLARLKELAATHDHTVSLWIGDPEG